MAARLGGRRYLDSLRDERRTPEYRRTEKARVLRPPAAVDQPRGLLGQADALLLGRLLRPARLQGRGLPGRASSGRAGRRGAPRRASATSSPRPRRLDRGRDARARDRLRAGLRRPRATSTPPRRPSRSRPAGAARSCPRAALERTFEQYWRVLHATGATAQPWEAFTPYEIRNVGAFVRLGWRDRALELLDYFLDDQHAGRMAAVGRGGLARRRARRASSAICRTPGSAPTSSARCSTCSPTRARDGRSLVLGAGVPMAWLAEEPGVAVNGPADPLRAAVLPDERQVGDAISVQIDGGLPQWPPAGIALRPPLPGRAGASRGRSRALPARRGRRRAPLVRRGQRGQASAAPPVRMTSR